MEGPVGTGPLNFYPMPSDLHNKEIVIGRVEEVERNHRIEKVWGGEEVFENITMVSDGNNVVRAFIE